MAEHVRIDEGVARPQEPQPPIQRSQARATYQYIPLDLNPDEVLERYISSESTSKIAESYGVRRHALVRWLRVERPEQWKQIQIIRALCTKEDGENEIYDAQTALSLARARELVRAAQWDLEKLDEDYKPQLPQVTVINNNLSLDSGTVQSVSDILKTVADKHGAALRDNSHIDSPDTDLK